MTERDPESVEPVALPEPALPPAPFGEGEPTQMMDAVELEADPAPAAPPPAIGPVVPESVVGIPEPERLGDDVDPTSAIDSLFGETQFREYESAIAPPPSESPFVRRAVAAPAGPPMPPAQPADPWAAAAAAKEVVPKNGHLASMTRLQKSLLWVLGALLAVLALVALFVLGTRLADAFGPAPAAVVTPSATPSASPVPEVFVAGPVVPGEYPWDELLGGECLEPYTSPWVEDFTVVDCAEPHTAQLTFRGLLTNASGGVEYPGANALAAQIGSICAAPGIVDLAVAGAVTDAQVQGSYPVDEEQWEENPRYYCFVSRSSGEPLTGSLAVPQSAEPAPYPVDPSVVGPAPAAKVGL